MLQVPVSELESGWADEQPNMDFSHYVAIFKKRFLYFLIPGVIVAVGGVAISLLWPPTYQSEGKILIESQQIPTDLVKPTVTAAAKERIQVIQQRVTTRDNLLALLDKYQLYFDRRQKLSRTELLDLMRDNIHIEPIEVDQSGRMQTIALRVGFSDQRPDVATKIANELVTLFLNEDARNRTNRAMETSRFLGRESQRLETELASLEVKMIELKRQIRASPSMETSVSGSVSPFSALQSELLQKSAIYSKSHPEVKRIEAQIAALKKTETTPDKAAGTPQSQKPPTGASLEEAMDNLLTQKLSIQKNLESANQKLAAARLGENLERDQFSERLEVLEQAVVPQKPIKPNRKKMSALAIAAAFMAGIAGVFAVESYDKTIRGSRDILRIAASTNIVIIPYLATQNELRTRRRRWVTVGIFTMAAFVISLLVVHFFVKPLDDIWTILSAKYV